MSLDTVLQNNNITATQAWDFISAHLTSPSAIYTEAQNAGLSTDMLTELVTRFDSSISGADVNQFFAGAGLDPAALGNEVEIAPPQPNSVVSFNSQGNAVIAPEGPLTDDQLIFVAGVIEASFISDPSGIGEEMLLTEQTPDGTLINVQFNDQDYQDIIVALTEQDLAAMNNLVTPIIDQLYTGAVQDLGYSSLEAFDAQGNAQDAQAVYDIVEAQIVSVIKPQYDALMAGQSDIWA